MKLKGCVLEGCSVCVVCGGQHVLPCGRSHLRCMCEIKEVRTRGGQHVLPCEIQGVHTRGGQHVVILL
jgi:hypothetical protein